MTGRADVKLDTSSIDGAARGEATLQQRHLIHADRTTRVDINRHHVGGDIHCRVDVGLRNRDDRTRVRAIHHDLDRSVTQVDRGVRMESGLHERDRFDGHRVRAQRNQGAREIDIARGGEALLEQLNRGGVDIATNVELNECVNRRDITRVCGCIFLMQRYVYRRHVLGHRHIQGRVVKVNGPTGMQ